ncbi:MAG: methyltransferase domain-containing protein [Anaerolineae bacterium]|nr:methyltransferase domain-containing protein [Anaerolineae bacterium]
MQRDIQRPKRPEEPFCILDYHERYCNEELIKYLSYRPGLTVLDCRCGDGVLLEQLEGRTGAAWGVDAPLEKLRCAWPPGQVSAAASDRLPFASGVFDAVIGREVLCSADDAVRVLTECARVLRPGGQLVLWERRRPSGRMAHRDVEHITCAAGLVPIWREPFDYLAYPVAVLASKMPLLACSYLGLTLLKAVFALDSLLVRVLGCRDWSWHLIVVAERRVES